MMRRQALAAGLAAAILTGCGGSFATGFDAPLDEQLSRSWQVAGVSVAVPASLTTTEANVLVPDADIVWHGEPRGDRRAQVARILEEGLRKGSAGLRGPTRVALQAQVVEFHGVTPIAVNQAPAAVHNISYVIRVVEASTGEILAGPDAIQADLPAFTQSSAVVAAANGVSERQRIVDHIARATAGWLGIGPDPRETFVSLGR